jgi:hypothetical protein
MFFSGCKIRSFFALLFVIHSAIYALKVTVDADGGGASYTSLNTFLQYINNNSSATVPDTVQFTGTDVDTFPMSNYFERTPTTGIVFSGQNDDPDMFPVINHTGDQYYNLFKDDKITFEKVVFTGNYAFQSANNVQQLIFRKCIIRGFSAVSFINFAGTGSVPVIFENCLFVNNSYRIFSLDIQSGGRKIDFVNCTFDNNTKIFGFSGSNKVDTNIVMKNCIFSANDSIYTSVKMKSNISYSLTSEASISGYGAGCVSGASQYIVATARAKPSDWKISQNSLAAKKGTSTGAPLLDIGGRTRTAPCDIGCWMPDVPVKPKVTDQPDTVIVNEDSTVVFSVVATGVELTYGWYKSESTVKLSDSAKFIIKAAFIDSGTKYICVVSNGGGTDSSKIAVMNVLKKPIITKDLADTSVSINDTLVLYVNATGTRVSFQWYRNKEVISGANDDTIVFKGAALTDNLDTFYCVVKNPLGAAVASKNCILTVKDNEGAKIKTEPLEDMPVTLGDLLSFSTEATGSGKIQYTWYRNGLTSKDSVGTGMVFSKTSAVMADSGIYHCIVNNGYGADTTVAVTVKVLDPSQVRCRILLKGTFIDCEHVKISFSNLKTVTSIFPNPNVDSIGLRYDTTGALKNVTQITIPLSRFQKNQDTYDTIIIVKSLYENCYNNFFLPVMFWKSPDTVHIGQLTNDGTVSMCSPEKLENPIKISCSHSPLSDTVKAIFTSIPEGKVRDSLKYLIVTYGNAALGFVNDTILVSKLPAGGTYEKTYTNGDFLNDPQTLTFSLRIKGILKNLSDSVATTVQVGIARPVNNIASLTVKDASPPLVSLEWTMSSTESVDSIRIWTGKTQIPLKFNPDPQTYTAVAVSGSERSGTVNNLEPGILYYFAAQIKKNDLWSSITVDSRTFKQMPEIDTQQVKNTIKIKKIGFDSTKNMLTVQWSMDSVGLGKTELQAAICFSVDSFSVNGPGENDTVIVNVNFNIDNITNIPWRGGKLFDKMYYISMFMRNKRAKWSFASSDAQKTIKIPKSQWESITFFNKGIDSVYVLNRSIVIIKGKNWDNSSILSQDEILSDTFPADINGFIKIGTPFRFKRAEQSSDIGIGARYNVVPNGFSAQDIYLYEYKDNKWYAVERVLVDSVSNMVFVNFTMDNASKRKNLHVLMIDTAVPVVQYNDDTSAIEPNESFLSPITIKDNIANVVCTLKCGMIDKTLAVVSIISLPDTIYSNFLSISNSTVTIKSENSFRIQLTVTDQHYKKTYDFSRQVKQDKNPETVYDETWVPISTRSVLNVPSIEKAFLGICEGDEWKYDSTKFRIFWYSGAQNKYIEYGNDKPDIFKVVPGKVFWLKKRGGATFDLGPGKTVSIKEPFKIQLPAKQWTDFCMPYKIMLSLADIFNSSNLSKEMQDSLWFFEFQSSNSSKTPKFSTVYYPVLGTNQSKKETVLKYTDDNAYTILNSTGTDIELTIPSIDISYSTAQDDGLQKRSQNDVWHVEITSKVLNDITSPIYCVFKSKGKGTTWLPSPPYPGSVRVGLLDSATNNTYGTMIFNEEKSGYSVPLFFSNNSTAESKTITYTFNSSKPEYLEKIALYNAETGKLEPVISSNSSLTLGPKEHAYRWALIGDSSYYNSWINNFVNVPFGLLKISQNSGNLLGIEYTVPYSGVSAVKVMVVNQLGQCVWSTVNRNLVPGKRNVTNWNTRNTNKLAAGAYIIQISSYNTMHRQTQRIQKRYLHFSR